MKALNSLSDHVAIFQPRGRVAEWLARRTRDLVVAGSIPNQAML